MFSFSHLQINHLFYNQFNLSLAPWSILWSFRDRTAHLILDNRQEAVTTQHNFTKWATKEMIQAGELKIFIFLLGVFTKATQAEKRVIKVKKNFS